MGHFSKRPGDRASGIVADILLRLFYFAATALIMFLAVLRLCNRHDIEMTQWHYLVIFGSALFFAVFGPYLQRLESRRSRDVKDGMKGQSERDRE